MNRYQWIFALISSFTTLLPGLTPPMKEILATEPQQTEQRNLPSSELMELPNTLDRASFPPMLVYHEIRVNQLYNKFDVHIDDLTAQLDWLEEAGYQTIHLDELYEALKARDYQFLENKVILTFDDGYLNNYLVVVPILQERDMKATFFIHLGAMSREGEIENYPQVGWEQVYEIDQNPLFNVYSHSITHPSLPSLTDQELEREIGQSRAIYEERLGKERPFFSYPMGHYDERVIAMVRQQGYQMAVAVSDQGLAGHPPQFSIPRIYMGTVMQDLDFFEYCVTNYKAMDPVCFEERWEPL